MLYVGFSKPSCRSSEDRSAKSHADFGGPVQETLEGTNTADDSCDFFFLKKYLLLCPCPKNLTKAKSKLKSFG